MAQRSASSDGVTATLWAVVEEIDDDDEDILEVTIDVTNESNRDLWDISGDIRAMDGTHAHARGAPSRIESGEDGELTFWVPSDTGAWLFKIDFNTDSGPGTVELGPFTNDLRIAATSRPERVSKNSLNSETNLSASSSDPMASVFGTALEGFGDEEERAAPLLETDVASNDPMQAAFAGGLLASQQAPSPPEQFVQPSAPSVGPAPSSPPSSPPPSSPPPSSPPSSPPSGAPTGPPPSSPPSTGPPGKPPGPPPSGSPPGPPPKSAKPPGPPPS